PAPELPRAEPPPPPQPTARTIMQAASTATSAEYLLGELVMDCSAEVVRWRGPAAPAGVRRHCRGKHADGRRSGRPGRAAPRHRVCARAVRRGAPTDISGSTCRVFAADSAVMDRAR